MKTERQKLNDNVATAVRLLAANCVFLGLFTEKLGKYFLLDFMLSGHKQIISARCSVSSV